MGSQFKTMMKKALLTLAKQTGIAVVSLVFVVQAQAASIFTATIFSDSLDAGASPSWGNEVGGWSAAGGAYRAMAPANGPAAFSSLPYDLTDFSVDFDVNDVEDGGIYLRSTPVPGSPLGIQGVLLNLKIPDRGPKIYWHIMTNGTDCSIPLNVAYTSYGSHPHVHIEVVCGTYSAFLNGSSTPATTLTTSLFASGRVALYASCQGGLWKSYRHRWRHWQRQRYGRRFWKAYHPPRSWIGQR